MNTRRKKECRLQGRGYLGWITITFVCIVFYSKLRVLELYLTELARVQAIEYAHAPARPVVNAVAQEECKRLEGLPDFDHDPDDDVKSVRGLALAI